MRWFLVLIAIQLFSITGRAQEVGLNSGLVEIINLQAPPQHVGLYPYLAVSMAKEWEGWVIAPNVGLEVSPELGAWGAVLSATADRPMVEHLGWDLLATVIHDQYRSDFKHAKFYMGVGTGFSFLFDAWSISPSMSVFRGLNNSEWSLVPIVNVGRTLE